MRFVTNFLILVLVLSTTACSSQAPKKEFDRTFKNIALVSPRTVMDVVEIETRGERAQEGAGKGLAAGTIGGAAIGAAPEESPRGAWAPADHPGEWSQWTGEWKVRVLGRAPARGESDHGPRVCSVSPWGGRQTSGSGYRPAPARPTSVEQAAAIRPVIEVGASSEK